MLPQSTWTTVTVAVYMWLVGGRGDEMGGDVGNGGREWRGKDGRGELG